MPIFTWGNDQLCLHIAHGPTGPPSLLAVTLAGDPVPDYVALMESALPVVELAVAGSGEFRWSRRTLGDLGLYDVGMVAYGQTGSKNRITATSAGSWSTSEMLPLGILEEVSTGRLIAWQVEHNGGWHWELGDRYNAVYLAASGPTASEHQWSLELDAGSTFRTAFASVALGNDLEEVATALTAYRRQTRHPLPDGTAIIYNDFLNALMADPTTDRELPLIYAAAELGAEIYCIDAITDFGLAYLKLDYNIDIGPGTDALGNVGAGLLEHNRAYLDWVSGVQDRYPSLIIEGCAAGGSRLDGASTSVFPILSLTDQQNLRLMPPIAATAPLALTPEQSGVWASVDSTMSDEELAFSVITALLSRIHLAGRIDTLTPNQRTVVRDALAVHRVLRHELATSTPVWPLGLPGWRDPWITAGRRIGNDLLLAVWRRSGEPKTRLPLPAWLGADPTAEVLYPTWGEGLVEVISTPAGPELEVALPAAPSARLVRLTYG